MWTFSVNSLTLKFFKHHCFRGKEVVECDPEMGWQQKEFFAKCLVDVALNKIALSSTSRFEEAPLRPLEGSFNTKHKGNNHG